MSNPTMYKIVRFYQDHRPSEIIDRGLTLEEAQAHCKREDTHGPDWFDGYEKDGNAPVLDNRQTVYDGENRNVVWRQG
jgi:hypothetical protein